MKKVLPQLSAICIDDGNTRCKVGIFRGGKLFKLHILPKRTKKALFEIKEIKDAGLPMIWSSVSKHRHLFLELSSRFENSFESVASLKLPFKNQYQAPGPGSDRLCAAVAAHEFFRGFPVLSIDAGTCLKFDFVSASGIYSGGSISPGLQMRYDAMHSGTGLLPPLHPINEEPLLTGNNTITCMHSGARLGMLLELESRMECYRKRFPSLRVVFTGGDINYLPISLKKNIFAEPDLVVYGLFILLSHQPKIKALIPS